MGIGTCLHLLGDRHVCGWSVVGSLVGGFFWLVLGEWWVKWSEVVVGNSDFVLRRLENLSLNLGPTLSPLVGVAVACCGCPPSLLCSINPHIHNTQYIIIWKKVNILVRTFSLLWVF